MTSHQDQYNHSFGPPPPPAHHPQAQFQTSDHYHPEEHYFPQQQAPPVSEQFQQQQVAQPVEARRSSQTSRPSHSRGKSRTFSLHSDKTPGKEKGNLLESHAEKEANRLHSKADPTLAISEAEPSAVAAMTQSSLAPLRSIQHKDSWGNPIVEPDKSNPTRSRWERPLDTIRSFEAAVDGGYVRKSIIRTDSEANWNRRNSYHPSAPPHFRPNSYYNSRPHSNGPAAAFNDPRGGQTARSSYYGDQGYDNQGHAGYAYDYGQRKPQRASRMYTDPQYQQYGRDPHNYHLNHKDRSYETVTSAAASGSSDQAGYQTDPTSSDNSSIERRSPAKRAEPVNDYGIGFAQSQSYSNANFTQGLGQNLGNHPLPPAPAGNAQQAVPRKAAPSLLKRQSTQQSQQERPAGPEKRKSWFSRRFSKNS